MDCFTELVIDPSFIASDPSEATDVWYSEGDSIPTNEERDRGVDQTMKAFCVVA
ncbi:hypothetical protein FA13DRAFT_1744138 [Coprinellus micaceus]|uniref:Pheromone n=1 Tax=Coprinellus micaceus TaxID=71717 RepID=A0A4Y7SD27_COPMI|nr:hypothetical protein FA13DRAFT_1744138 [Coprinellus micaceus]